MPTLFISLLISIDLLRKFYPSIVLHSPLPTTLPLHQYKVSYCVASFISYKGKYNKAKGYVMGAVSQQGYIYYMSLYHDAYLL